MRVPVATSPVLVRAAELVAAHGSPLYVYEADVVRDAFHTLRAAFPYPETELHFAVVCNKNRYLVRLLHSLGAKVHANTPGDAHAALTAGVPARDVVYSGTNLGASDLDELVTLGIPMNLDSVDQVRDLAARVAVARSRGAGTSASEAFGLRVLIDDPSKPNRIGVTPEEIDEALVIASRAGLRLLGLHMYAGTNTLDASRFLACFDRLVSAAKRVPALRYLDAGGGFGIPYSDAQRPLDLASLGRELSLRMEALSLARGRRIRLHVEPGRFLVAAAGSLLTTVVSVKERGGRRYVGVDTTVGNIVVESVYHSHHRVEAVAPRGEPLPTPTDVCGNTTHSRDYLGRSLRLPLLSPGDLLALRDVGAYGYAMSSHFLNRPRPAEVVLDGDEVHLTTRRETYADLLATQVTS